MKKIKSLTTVSLFSALLCIGCPFTVPVFAVPFTLSLFFVFLSGLALPPTHAAAANAVYILIGFAGLPVFSGFQGGFSVLLSPTGGFLITYPIMAFTVSILTRKANGRKPLILAAFALSLVICYTAGTIWFSAIANTGIVASIAAAVLPFIPADIIKCALAFALSRKINKFIA